MSKGVYIPRRLYERLKCIYTERFTAVSAPAGSGKTTVLREFVRRSRPDGISCRFITGCATADACFGRICDILLGRSAHLPVINEDFVRLYGSFAELRLKKPVLIVVDCVCAAEMLLGNLHCMELLSVCDDIHIVITCEDNSYFHDRLIHKLNICEILERDFSLTDDEAMLYLEQRGVSGGIAETICRRSLGNIFRIRLNLHLLHIGTLVEGDDILDLITAAILEHIDRRQLLALLCACAFEDISDRMCSIMAAVPVLHEYFGEDCFERRLLIEQLVRLNDILPISEIDFKSGACKVHLLVKRAAYRYYNKLPQKLRLGMHMAVAKEYTSRHMAFEAFCNYIFIEDYISAERVIRGSQLSVYSFFTAKHLMYRFAVECSLDCKPIIPVLLHVLMLLMFTQYKKQVEYRFDDIISHVTSSDAFSETERRNMLAYVHAMRTFQDFYDLDSMGMHIKRAYDYYSGSVPFSPPFYSWALYAPSMYALVRRFGESAASQSEKFVRYHNMYTEITQHGRFFEQVYLTEQRYCVGDMYDARKRALAIADEAVQPEDIPPRLIALTVAGSCSLMVGTYDEYKECVSRIAEVTRRYPSTEIDYMGVLCLALLSCHKGGGAEIWRITALTDEVLLTNRYTAPFGFFVRCISMLKDGDYQRLLSRKDLFLDMCSKMHCESLKLKITMCAASAHFRLGERGEAARIMRGVFDVIAKTETIMPVVEHCIHEAELFAYLAEALPEHTDYIREIMRISKHFRRNVENICTQEMTEIGGFIRHYRLKYADVENEVKSMCALRKELGLTERALCYALLAARNHSNAEIAEICNTTTDSVKSSLKRIFAKLGLRSRSQLRYVLRLE